MNPFRLLLLLGVAVLLTLLNAFKPLHMDDTAYYHYASQIAEHPLDPYGFDVHWYDFPLPANHVLAPPLLPYWWAIALRLFGDQPLAWKLWLLPFSLLLVFSLHWLLRRFARGLELPLTCMAVLSPTLLPSFNLMLDVPALALGLTAVVLSIRSVDRRSWRGAVAAGLVAGLAMQTKYTAFLVPGVILLYAWQYRQLRLGVLAAALAVVVFTAWEGLVALGYGESHFLYHWRHGPSDPKRPFVLIMPLLGILGGTAATVGLLALTALGASRRTIVFGAAFVILGVVALAVVPDAYTVYLQDEAGKPRLTLNNLIVGPAGVLVGLALVSVAGRLRTGRADRFLVLWLVLEVVGYCALTPYAAVRRVLGVAIIATLVVGRLAARSCREPERRQLVQGVVALSIVLALVYLDVDYRDAGAERRAVARAARWVRRRDPEAQVYFAGHWGFQFYAERAGLTGMVPHDSRPRSGDWLVIPDRRVTQPPAPLEPHQVTKVTEMAWHDRLGLRTVPCFYCGNSALNHHEGPRITVTIYRVR
jgi:hypothetical protein